MPSMQIGGTLWTLESDQSSNSMELNWIESSCNIDTTGFILYVVTT